MRWHCSESVNWIYKINRWLINMYHQWQFSNACTKQIKFFSEAHKWWYGTEMTAIKCQYNLTFILTLLEIILGVIYIKLRSLRLASSFIHRFKCSESYTALEENKSHCIFKSHEIIWKHKKEIVFRFTAINGQLKRICHAPIEMQLKCTNKMHKTITKTQNCPISSIFEHKHLPLTVNFVTF